LAHKARRRFLLPTSNITNLLLLGHVPLPAAAYVSDSWLAWILVTAITAGPLAWWAGATTASAAPAVTAGLSVRAVSDLLPMFPARLRNTCPSRSGLALPGSFTGQVTTGALLATAAGNLPAAAEIVAAGTPGLWAAILATSVGPDLLVTGSVATLITRRAARDSGARLSAWQFAAIGLVLVPAQLAAATLGLHLTGALS
jgi:Na+/H+ antiporter NhaD/arsenite permease-like protein